ncbi:MAG TPA: DUF1003 domain-containing protein [Solirubrobacteraceae bacterium]|jgi:uncharacterized membrane protein|nr:DUF1003 domain-containing protein [Solirubrobacteraceae bacterium]
METTMPVPAGDKPASDPLRHYDHYQEGGTDSLYAGGSSFMERVAEGVASGLGTVGFVVISTMIIIVWVVINATKAVSFDGYPFILLNLAFSAQAFYTGALVIIAQKAQTRTDKANEEASARHRDELAKYQSDLLEKNTELTEQIHALAEQLHTLTQEVHTATCRGGKR